MNIVNFVSSPLSYVNDYVRYDVKARQNEVIGKLKSMKLLLTHKESPKEQDITQNYWVTPFLNKIPASAKPSFETYYWEPKEILCSSPEANFYSPPKDIRKLQENRNRVIKTRPRVLLSPAIPVDDVEGEFRDRVQVKYIYQIDRAPPQSKVNSRFECDPVLNIQKFPYIKEKFDDIPKALPLPYMPPKVKPGIKSWEGSQLRWLKCALKEPGQEEDTRKEVERLIEANMMSEEELLMWHRKRNNDITRNTFKPISGGFTGHIPSQIVHLETDFENRSTMTIDPMITTSQALASRNDRHFDRSPGLIALYNLKKKTEEIGV